MVSNKTLRYPALVDGREGAYGVVFPDLPGCVAMGYTVEDALINAEDARPPCVTTPWMQTKMARSCRSPAPSSLWMSRKAVSWYPSLSSGSPGGKSVPISLLTKASPHSSTAKPDAAK